jgi:hypothetical protein
VADNASRAVAVATLTIFITNTSIFHCGLSSVSRLALVVASVAALYRVCVCGRALRFGNFLGIFVAKKNQKPVDIT